MNRLFLLLDCYVQDVVGREHIPDSPCIVAANHVSPLDPLILMRVLRRYIIFVASKYLFNGFVLKRLWFRITVFWLGRAIPAGGSFERCKAVLKRGKTLGLFVEGDIHPALSCDHTHVGAIALSHRTQIPILPVHLVGTGSLWPITNWPLRLWRLRSVRVIIGAPIPPIPAHCVLSRADYEEQAYALREAIGALIE